MSDEHPRRRFQFRLRTLFIITAAVAALSVFAKSAIQALTSLAEIDDPPATRSK